MTEKRKLYERDRIILKTGLIGILVNFVLAAGGFFNVPVGA